jgi:hypothetical protein
MLLRVFVLLCGLWLAFAQVSVAAHEVDHPFHDETHLCDQLIQAENIQSVPPVDNSLSFVCLNQARQLTAYWSEPLCNSLSRPTARGPPRFS